MGKVGLDFGCYPTVIRSQGGKKAPPKECQEACNLSAIIIRDPASVARKVDHSLIQLIKKPVAVVVRFTNIIVWAKKDVQVIVPFATPKIEDAVLSTPGCPT